MDRDMLDVMNWGLLFLFVITLILFVATGHFAYIVLTGLSALAGAVVCYSSGGRIRR